MPELANARHELFAVLMAQAKGSATECYKLAGYKAKSDGACKTNASRLLSNADVVARITELRAPAIKAAGLDTNRIVRRMIQIAYGDIRSCMSWDSKGIKVKRSRDLTDEQAMMISEVKKLPDGTVVVKLHKPDGALRMLAQHFGMLQGETAPTLVENNYSDNRTMVYVDAPRTETAEQWQARVARERGMKLVEGKVE